MPMRIKGSNLFITQGSNVDNSGFCRARWTGATLRQPIKHYGMIPVAPGPPWREGRVAVSFLRMAPDNHQDANPSRKRRSARIVLRVPLLVNVVDSPPESPWESVETVMVSKHGAMIRAKSGFQVGDTLDIRVRNGERSGRARVVWTSSQVTPHGIELGFELLDEEGFWEINFPPDRWSEKTRPDVVK